VHARAFFYCIIMINDNKVAYKIYRCWLLCINIQGFDMVYKLSAIVTIAMTQILLANRTRAENLFIGVTGTAAPSSPQDKFQLEKHDLNW
jgi:hypothetical protein